MPSGQGEDERNVLIQCEGLYLCLCLLHPCFSPSSAQTGGKLLAISDHMMKNRTPQVSAHIYMQALRVIGHVALMAKCGSHYQHSGSTL